MKKYFTLEMTVRLFAVMLVLGFFGVVASAQCDSAAETALYQKFLDNYRGTAEQQKTANDLGKDYVAKFGECPSEAEKKITDYVKKFLAKYQDFVIESDCINAVNNTPLKAFDQCRPLLAKDPESLRTHLLLSLAGLKNISANDGKSNEQTLAEIRKVFDLIASGKTVDKWIVADSKEEATAVLQYYSGYLTVNDSPAEAAAVLTKVAHSSSAYSKNPSTYFQLGLAIYNDQVKKQSDEYNDKCTGDKPGADCPAMLGRIYLALDRVIDAYARSVALSRSNPEYKKLADSVNPTLASLYKQRHDNSDVGLEQFVSDVLSKPLP